MSLRSGDRLGPFEIIEPLGRGGMGEVFRARDAGLEREVAVKALSGGVGSEPGRLARFLREARLLASLRHPRIAGIYGLEDRPGGERFLILELIQGETLRQRLRGGPISLDETLRLGLQICEGLEAAHACGVIHRDLKPSNLMIEPDGEVKILDFGLAKRMRDKVAGQDEATALETTATHLPDAGQVAGTPGYMSPEQTRGSAHDHRTDLFALGCVLFECLAGAMAFAGDTTNDVLAAVLLREPNWALLPPIVPHPVRRLLERCLHKDPEFRPNSASEVRAILGGAAGVSPAVRSEAGTGPPPESGRLPLQLTSFVGREREIVEVERLLARTRLLTLTGPAGCGKTRLSLRLAERVAGNHPDGTWFVDLAPLADPELVAPAVAASCGVEDMTGRPAADVIADRFKERRSLLILDNCERLLPACADLAERLLRSCPGLKFVTTSRERLAISGEQVYPVPPLSVPGAEATEGGTAAERFDAIRLFEERAALVRPGRRFTVGEMVSVVAICRHLDGIPLAIELAAARMRSLSPDQLLARLGDRFRLLQSGARGDLPRHQTLHAAIEWSYDQLPEEERSALRSLSVFAGGWTLESAGAVCLPTDDPFAALDLITRLVDKSLVMVAGTEDQVVRYGYLESIREFALARLRDAGEEQDARVRHLEHHLKLAEEAEPNLRGPDQIAWLARLESEHENLLAALAWCERDPDGPERGIRMVAALWVFWDRRGHISIARGEMARALARSTAGSPTPARAKALRGAGRMSLHQGDTAEGRACFEKSLVISRELGDTLAVAQSLNGIASAALDASDLAAARKVYEEALEIFRSLGDRRGTAAVLGNLGMLAGRREDDEVAYGLLKESLEILRALGDSASMSLRSSTLGFLARRRGDLEAAREHLREAISLAHRIGHQRNGSYALAITGGFAGALGDHEFALRTYAAVGELQRRLGSIPSDEERYERDVRIADAKSSLGPERSERIWDEGSAMSLDVASQSALEWLSTPTGSAPRPE